MLVVSLVTASGSISSSPRWLVFLTNQVELVLVLKMVRKTNPIWLVFTIMGGFKKYYMYDQQGGVLLAVHSLLEGLLVVSTYRKPSPPASLTPMHKLTWAVQTTAWCVCKKKKEQVAISVTIIRCVALQISLAYWLAVHPFLVSRGLLTSAEAILLVAVPGARSGLSI